LTRTAASVDQALRLQVSLPDPKASATEFHSELSYHYTLYLKARFITLHSPRHTHTHTHTHKYTHTFPKLCLPFRFPALLTSGVCYTSSQSILLNTFNYITLPDNRSTAAQGITRNLWNLDFHYRYHYSPSLYLFWERLIQFMYFHSIDFKSHLISYSLLRSGLSSGLFSSDLTLNLCMHFSTARAKGLDHRNPLDFITWRIPLEECKSLTWSLQSSSAAPCLLPSSEAQVPSPSILSHYHLRTKEQESISCSLFSSLLLHLSLPFSIFLRTLPSNSLSKGFFPTRINQNHTKILISVSSLT
jgi:hypothetical protein